MAKSPSEPVEPAAEPSSIAQFEKSLDELEKLVAKMEGGELSLDESLRSFERGIALFRNCQNALEQAELRVKLLLDPNDPAAAQEFDADE
jgi:exodeoxyribonuclease VII small subunit